MADVAIALFVYRRPKHTRTVLDGLKQNAIDKLYVFSDGPAAEAVKDQVQHVRNIVKAVDWTDVELIVSEQNKGLGQSRFDGIRYIFEHHDGIVMLEDDCVPTPDFVHFMRQCLDKYRGNDRVMNIHGYSPPIEIPPGYAYDVYFTHRIGSWGQAFWKEDWKKLETEPDAFRELFSTPRGRKQIERAGSDLVDLLESEVLGEVDSWDVWWALSVVKYGALSVNPVQSRIRSIGQDGTGTHTVRTSRFDVDVTETPPQTPLKFPERPFVDETINRRYNRVMGKGTVLDRIRQIIIDVIKSDKPLSILRRRLDL